MRTGSEELGSGGELAGWLGLVYLLGQEYRLDQEVSLVKKVATLDVGILVLASCDDWVSWPWWDLKCVARRDESD